MIDMTRFTPSEPERENGMITKNAVTCRICGANADRFNYGFQCQSDPAHFADLVTGIFSDRSYSPE